MFNMIIESLNLREIELMGRQFTWANSLPTPTYEKLDRVLAIRSRNTHWYRCTRCRGQYQSIHHCWWSRVKPHTLVIRISFLSSLVGSKKKNSQRLLQDNGLRLLRVGLVWSDGRIRLDI